MYIIKSNSKDKMTQAEFIEFTQSFTKNLLINDCTLTIIFKLKTCDQIMNQPTQKIWIWILDCF